MMIVLESGYMKMLIIIYVRLQIHMKNLKEKLI